MSKKILIISTSPRKGGNSDILADEFEKGAVSLGNEVEKVSLYNKEIGFCKGCFACQQTKRCIIHDDADVIVQKMLNVDVIVFATPIYFYEMCGQMKTLLDRTNPLFTCDYKFKDIYLLATAADEAESSMDGVTKGLNGWVECFENTKLKGIVKGVGMTDIGDVNKNTSKLNEAYEMGRNV